MTEVTITALPPVPIHRLELWDVAATGLANLPPFGRWSEEDGVRLLHVEPNAWLIEGDCAVSPDAGGALTAIGGGLVRADLSGPGWRRLLMEGGVFDAEDPAFAAGCCAVTVIERVKVVLAVLGTETCRAYLPSSYAESVLGFWHRALPTLD